MIYVKKLLGSKKISQLTAVASFISFDKRKLLMNVFFTSYFN